MAPKPRNAEYSDLPDNLYAQKKKNKTYYSYKKEDSKFVGFGTNKKDAIAAARILNQDRISDDTIKYVRKSSNTYKFSTFLDYFETTILPDRGYAEKTLYDYVYKFRNIKKALGEIAPDDIEIKHISNFLKGYPARQSNSYRTLLMLIFKFAIAEGVRRVQTNPASATIPHKEVVARQRLTIEGFKAIYKHAVPVMKNIMDLALITLQRREDLAAMKWNQWSWKKETLKLIQIKEKVPLKIQAGADLLEVIRRCQDNVVSRYIIHQGKDANRLRKGNGLSPGSLSRGFATARGKSKFFDKISRKSHPTLHEIRSLGADLYRKAGIPEREIQRLLGHKSASMTKKYLAGHEVPFEQVAADLDLKTALQN